MFHMRSSISFSCLTSQIHLCQKPSVIYVDLEMYPVLSDTVYLLGFSTVIWCQIARVCKSHLPLYGPWNVVSYDRLPHKYRFLHLVFVATTNSGTCVLVFILKIKLQLWMNQGCYWFVWLRNILCFSSFTAKMSL